jgi:hypothetical protein
MFQSFSNTWNLLGSSLHVLGKDRELLVFPIASGIVSVVVLLSFLGGAWGSGVLTTAINEIEAATSEEGRITASQVVMAVIAFAYYFVSYAAIIYFNAALIGAAHIRLTGGDPTIADGLRAANACLPAILGYALIAATVGVLLSMLRDNSNNVVARIVVGIIGMAWTLITFLVVPVIVIERLGPVAAIGRSTRLLKETWGEQIVSNLGFGLINLLIAIPGVLLLGGGIALAASGGSPALVVGLIGIAVLYWILQGIVMSALKGIFVAALYAHAAHEPLQGFPQEVVATAFRPR